MMIAEINEDEIEYNEKTNRLIVTVDKETKLSIPPQVVRDLLPYKDEAEKVKDLAMIIHDINKEKLINARIFAQKILEIDADIEEARKTLESCEKMVCIKKWQAVIDAYNKRKGTLAQLRLLMGLLEKEKRPLRTRIAKLGADVEDVTGEKKGK